MRGKAFSERSDDSMRNSCMPPTRKIGNSAMEIKMMPMPPSHCSMARQIRMPGGSTSRSAITVAPVVVTPDIASKKASVNVSGISVNSNGSVPNSGITIHASVVTRKAWRSERLNGWVRYDSVRPTPTNRVTTAEARNTIQSAWPAAPSTAAATHMPSDSVTSSRPRMKATGRKSRIGDVTSACTVAEPTAAPARLLRSLLPAARPVPGP